MTIVVLFFEGQEGQKMLFVNHFALFIQKGDVYNHDMFRMLNLTVFTDVISS